MLGWEALELARRYEGLEVSDSQSLGFSPNFFKFDKSRLMFKECGGNWSHFKWDRTLHLSWTSWVVSGCPHKEEWLKQRDDLGFLVSHCQACGGVLEC